jgi:predicted transcriptional regulator
MAGRRSKLEYPWNRNALIRDLAIGNQTQTQLAAEFGVSQSAICEFKQRHEDEIIEVTNDLANEYAGLRLAEKAERIATYTDIIETALDTGETKNAIRALRNIAEELGHLKLNIAADVNTTRYVIETPDGTDLGETTT